MRSPRRLITAWRLARDAGVSIFEPGALDRLKAVPGWSTLGLSTADDASGAAVMEAIRALELLDAEHRKAAHTVQIVATLPGAGSDVATTADAVIDLIRSAKTELLVLGFGLSDERLWKELISAAERTVAVTVVGERSRDELLTFARTWPAIVPTATFLHLVEPPQGVSAIMHAKVIVADRRRALVGSANFSAGGLRTNMELGLQIDGPEALRICTIVDKLHSSKWLEPLELENARA